MSKVLGKDPSRQPTTKERGEKDGENTHVCYLQTAESGDGQ